MHSGSSSLGGPGQGAPAASGRPAAQEAPVRLADRPPRPRGGRPPPCRRRRPGRPAGDDHALHAGAVTQRRGQRGPQPGVDEQHPGPGVAQDVGDLRRRQARIERHQHRAGQRHAVVGHERQQAVRCQHRHPVAAGHAGGAQRRRQAVGALPERAVVEAPVAFDHRGAGAEGQRRSLQERQRRQLGAVGRRRRRRVRAGALSRRWPGAGVPVPAPVMELLTAIVDSPASGGPATRGLDAPPVAPYVGVSTEAGRR